MFLNILSQYFPYHITSLSIKMTSCIIRVITIFSHIFFFKNFIEGINIKSFFEKKLLFLIFDKSSCKQQNTLLFAQVGKILNVHPPVFFTQHIVITSWNAICWSWQDGVCEPGLRYLRL